MKDKVKDFDVSAEVDPVRISREEDGKLYYEKCEPSEALCWGVYLRRPDGLTMHVRDYYHEAEARSLADDINKALKP